MTENTNSGVYRIAYITTGKIYVGSSANLRGRWQEHRKLLNKKEHHSSHLQNSWNKYGAECFVFEVIEHCQKEILIEREQHWLNTLKPFRDDGFNTLTVAGSNAGYRHSATAIEKIRSAAKRRKNVTSSYGMSGKKHSENARYRISVSQRKNYIVTPPDSGEMFINGLNALCKEHGLTLSAMSRVASGIQPNHKGWKCRKADD